MLPPMRMGSTAPDSSERPAGTSTSSDVQVSGAAAAAAAPSSSSTGIGVALVEVDGPGVAKTEAYDGRLQGCELDDPSSGNGPSTS